MAAFAELIFPVAALGAGLVAGLCFAFSSFIMTALDDLGPAAAIRAMQAINTRILRSGAMAIWFGTVGVGALAVFLADDHALTALPATLYAVGAILITGFANVPLNEALDRVKPDAVDAEQAWRHYREKWSRWNAMRTATFAFASVGFTLSL